MTEEKGENASTWPNDEPLFERRREERRSGQDRRGSLRWDPRAAEKERRSGLDRRQAFTQQN